MSPITIRALTPQDDLTELLALCRAFLIEYQQHHDVLYDIGCLQDSDLIGRFQDSISNELATTLLALDGDDMVGYASLAIREQPPFYALRQIGAISGLMVTPSYRRLGIGADLLTAAADWFRRMGIRYYTVYTSSVNQPAIDAYLAHGMQPLYTAFWGDTAQDGTHRA